MNNKAIFSIVAVTLLLMTAVPLVGGGSEGTNVGNFEMGQMTSDYEKADEKIICDATLEPQLRIIGNILYPSFLSNCSSLFGVA